MISEDVVELQYASHSVGEDDPQYMMLEVVAGHVKAIEVADVAEPFGAVVIRLGWPPRCTADVTDRGRHLTHSALSEQHHCPMSLLRLCLSYPHDLFVHLLP